MGLLLATFLFTFYFSPFWIVLVLGISFSIVLYPLYEWFLQSTCRNQSQLSSRYFVCTRSLRSALGIGVMVFDQSESVYHLVVNNKETGPLYPLGNSINEFLPGDIVFDLQAKVSDFISYVSSNIANIFSTTVSAFSFILMLLIIFYFLRDGKHWKEFIVRISPLEDKDDEKIITRLALSINAIIKGYFTMAFIQGILMGFGLWLFNVRIQLWSGGGDRLSLAHPSAPPSFQCRLLFSF